MKGLLIKDFCLLKGQKNVLVTMLLISVLFLVVQEEPSFVIYYIPILAAMLAVGTLSYDESQNGMSYLLTMPVGRTEYVREKYVFGFLVCAAAIGTGYLLTTIAGIVKGGIYENNELLSGMLVGMLLDVFILAFTIPLRLKFGAEKGRLVLIGVAGGVIVAGHMAIKLLGAPLRNIFGTADKYLENNGQMAAVICVGVGLVLLAVSYFASVGIMKRKQF